MNILPVPFIRQIHIDSCGAAALEMVYKYYGIENISQEEIFNGSKKHDIGNGRFILKEETLVSDAENRDFCAQILQFTFENIKDMAETLNVSIECKIPLIVCQQSEENSVLGHYRIVIGVDKKNIYFQDPNMRKNFKYMKWPHEKFFNHWKPNGKTVLGNTCTIITKKGTKVPYVIQNTVSQEYN